MALTKETKEDKIEIVGEYKTIQIRTATIIKEDGVEINRSFHRRTLDCIASEKNEATVIGNYKLENGIYEINIKS